MLDIILRSDVNGTSATRSKRCWRRSVTPSLRSATRKAASVGSPWISQPPSLACRRVGVAGQAAAAEHDHLLGVQRPAFEQRALVLDLALGRVADAGDVRAARSVITRSIVISERVSVPVLSEQITEAEPSVSTDDRFLTIAWCRAMRCTPSASTTDRIAGSPSGTAATASDTPSSSTRVTSPALRMSDSANSVPITTTAMMTTAMPSMRPMRATSCASGVGSSAVASSSVAIAPISVSIAVAVTTARPLPCATAVPLKTMFRRSPSGTAAASVAASFSTASLSPVSEASCTRSAVGFDQARVGADGVALAEQQQVAAHQLGAGHAQRHAVAHHGRGGLGHARQRGHRVARLGFLHEAQGAVEQHDGRDHDRIDRPAGAAFEPPGGQRDRDRGQQQVDQRVLEMRQHAAPRRQRWRAAQHVAAVLREPLGGFCGAEAAFEIGAERVRNVGGVGE